MAKRFQIIFLPPTDLRPYYQNVKIHDKKQVSKLVKLLQKYDFDQPIVVDANRVIIKGHGRYMAALVMNKKLVPVIVRDDLTPEQVALSRISDNKLFELGSTNKAILEEELRLFGEEGGKGAEEFFDFMKPTKVDVDLSGDKEKKVKVKDAPDFSGSMQVCPKCANTFWEQA